MTNKKRFKFLKVVLAISLVVQTGIVQAATFSDVSESSKFFVSIEYLQGVEVLSGYEDGSFQPENKVNRVEALKIILSGSNIESPEVLEKTAFPDVNKNDWYAKYVVKAQEIGIVKGNDDGTFAPARPVNKVEFLKMILIANEVDVTDYAVSEDVFLDVDKDAWYFSYLNFAQATGLIRFNGEAKLEPGKELTRGEVSDIMYLLIALKKQNNSKFLLEQSELEVISAMNLLNVKQYDDAYNAADIAYDFASQALNVDQNEQNTSIIESAIKLSDSIKKLIDTYKMIVYSQDCEGAIENANITKVTATEAWEKNNDVQKVAHLIKEQADLLIDQCNTYLSGSGSTTE